MFFHISIWYRSKISIWKLQNLSNFSAWNQSFALWKGVEEWKKNYIVKKLNCFLCKNPCQSNPKPDHAKMFDNQNDAVDYVLSVLSHELCLRNASFKLHQYSKLHTNWMRFCSRLMMQQTHYQASNFNVFVAQKQWDLSLGESRTLEKLFK